MPFGLRLGGWKRMFGAMKTMMTSHRPGIEPSLPAARARLTASRRILLVAGLAAGLAAGCCCGAKQGGAKATGAAKAPGATAVDETERVALTGSHLRQPVKRAGTITDGAQNVVVMDRTAIERTGATTLEELFGRQTPFR